MAKDIKVDELKQKMDKDEPVVLIDVREPHEHEAFNIGGKLIPVGSLSNRMDEIEDQKEAEIVVYCRSGQRSGVAKTLLERAGYKNVRNLLGGMLDWADHYGKEQK
ncbi:MAG: rhodanese-like domain-containing protein [Bacteroidetes bacterium]|jgi:rhodanese-related sulfurtransferase|nr:rhodanese-like domain-containing protein [Bacteroidota bacterium]